MTVAALERLYAGDPAGALALLDTTAPPDALDAEALVACGIVQLANHRPAMALPALRAAVALGETAPATLLNLALAELQAGDADRAFRLMEELQRRLPEWHEPPLRLAEAFRAAGRMQEAEQAYGRVLEINPQCEPALLGLAGLLIMRGDCATARDLLLRCCGIAPQRADAWDTLGLALRGTAEAALAESAFAKAQELAPQVLAYALHRVAAARAAGTEEALLAWLDVATHEDPLDAVLITARGILLEQLGRREEAADALEAAVALAPEAPLPVYVLGEVLARSNRLDDAEAALRRASELDPDNAEASQYPRHGAVPHAPSCRGAQRTSRAARSRRRARQRAVQSRQCHHVPRVAGRRRGRRAAGHRACAGCIAAAACAVQHADLS